MKRAIDSIDAHSPACAARGWGLYLAAFTLIGVAGAVTSNFVYPSGHWEALLGWSEFWVLAGTLVVIWYYTERTAAMVRLQTDANKHKLRPLIAIERLELADDRRNVHFYAKNIGPGTATNVAVLIQTAVSHGIGAEARNERGFQRWYLNAIAHDQRTLLPEKAEVEFRDVGGEGKEVRFCLLAEGLDPKTLYITFGVYRGSGNLDQPWVLRHAVQVELFSGNLLDYLDLHEAELHRPIQELRDDVLKRHSGSPRYDGKGLLDLETRA